MTDLRSIRPTRAMSTSQGGFTLTELLVVIGLIGILLALTGVNLIRPQTEASLEGDVLTISNDIKAQQLRAMSGDSGSDAVTEPFGVYVQSNQYTLFKDAAYNGGSADNFVIPTTSGITLSTNFPSSQVVFSKGTGDVNNFNASTNTITITNSAGESKVLTINRYGAITVN